MNKQEFLEQGHIIIENFFDPDKENIPAIINENLSKLLILSGDKNHRYSRFLGVHPVFEDLILKTNIASIVRAIMGIEHINISDYQMLTLHPGAPSINAHADYPFVLMEKLFIDPIAEVSVLFILDDMEEDNGATMIIPGSHKRCCWPDKETFEKEAKKLLLKKGSVLIFHGATHHSTAANLSERDRSNILISFCAPWIKPLATLDNNVNKEKISDELKELLGYKQHQFIYKNLREKQFQKFRIQLK